MGKISRIQKDYIKAYEELNKDFNVNALIMLTEMSYEEKEKLAEYKLDTRFKSEEYCQKIDVYYRHMISTFFKMEKASSIYDNFKDIFSKVYLDNTDDDTNDYKDETMIKLNKIFNFINNVGDQDLKGTELLSLIRRETSDEEIDEPLDDKYFDVMFEDLKKECDSIKEADVNDKLDLLPEFFTNVGDMEAHLFRKKLFYDDYRKSVTGLTNYLFIRAGIPIIYIKPIELDSYYEYVNNANEAFDNKEIETFYKEKICDSIENAFIVPMKDAIKYYTDESIKKELGDFDNKIVTLRQNKYK